MKLYALLLFSFVVVSCTISPDKFETKSKNLTIKFSEDKIFEFRKKLLINPKSDTIIFSKGFSVHEVSETIAATYATKSQKIVFTKASNDNYNIVVVNHNPNATFEELVIELSNVLAEKKLLEFKLIP
jgi:hypothetical protein